MTIFDNKIEIGLANAPASPALGAATGLFENVGAAASFVWHADTTASRDRAFKRGYADLIDRLKEGGEGALFANPYHYEAPRSQYSWHAPVSRADREGRIWAEIERRRASDPEALPGVPATREAFQEAVIARTREIIDDDLSIMARANGWGEAGQFIGGVAGSFAEPWVVATLPLGAGWSSSLLRTAATEGAIAAGSEALALPGIAPWRDELGLPMSREEAITRVAFAALGGAAFPTAVKGAVRAAPAVRLKGGEFLHWAGEKLPLQRAENRALLKAYENQIDAEDAAVTTPFGAGEHAARLDEADGRLAHGEGPVVQNRAEGVYPSRAELDDAGLELLDPAAVEIDAKTFQFKQGGDAQGVTDRLAGVEIWDPVKAGVVLVWERADGVRFAADGHQRHGLALRAKAAGQSPQLLAHVFRESEGVSAGEARLVAALKNIAEGTGTAIDAAKVLRADPARLAELPPRSALVRQAGDLARLDDEAFGLVVNEVVEPRLAAVVGRLIEDDPALQLAGLKLLKEAMPANLVEAEAMVRQLIAADVPREVQIGLFGAEEVARNLFKERARVLDQALKKLRKERSIFETLTREADRIEAEGNTLARSTNAERADVNAQALEILGRLANRTGPLSDALGAAARTLADTGRLADAVDGFVDAVRSASAAGDLGGGPAVRNRSGRAAADEGAALAADGDARLEGFSERGGKAAQEQADFLDADNQGRLDQAEFEAGLDGFVRQALADKQSAGRMVLGTITAEQAGLIDRALAAIGIKRETEGFAVVLNAQDVRHAWRKHGVGNEPRAGQPAIDVPDFALIPRVLDAPDKVDAAKARPREGARLKITKQLGDHVSVVLEMRRAKGGHFAVISMWKQYGPQGGPKGSGGGSGARRGGSMPSDRDGPVPQRPERDGQAPIENLGFEPSEVKGAFTVPLDEAIDADGVRVAVVRTADEIAEEIEADEAFLRGVEGCLK